MFGPTGGGWCNGGDRLLPLILLVLCVLNWPASQSRVHAHMPHMVSLMGNSPSPSQPPSPLYPGGVFRVAGLYSRSNDTAFNLYDFVADVSLQAWSLMESRINQHGGIIINDISYQLVIQPFNVGTGETPQDIQRMLTYANDIIVSNKYGYFPIVLAPYITSYTVALASLCDSARRIMLTMDVTDYIYVCPDPVDPIYSGDCISRGKRPGERRYDYIYSTLLPASKYWSGAIYNLKIAGAQTVGLIYTSDLGSVLSAKGIMDAVQQSGMTMVHAAKIQPNESLSNPQLTDSIVRTLQSIEGELGSTLDVLFVHTNDGPTDYFVNSMIKYNYIVKAGIFAIPPGVYGPGMLNGGVDSTKYFTSAIQFDPRLKTTVSPSTYPHDVMTSSSDPNTGAVRDDAAYQAFTIISNNVPFYSPFHPLIAAQIVIIQRALANIRDINFTFPDNSISASSSSQRPFMDALRTSIQNMYQDSFYGRLQFDQFGRYATDAIVWQTNIAAVNDIVYPINSATAKFIYPIPTWDERIYTPQYAKRSYERIILGVASMALIILAILMIGIAWYRNARLVRAASPAFLQCMLCGCMLMIISIYTWTLYETSASCTAHVWLFSIGYVLMFSPLFAKTWRLYAIFCSKQMTVLNLTDRNLAFRGPIPMLILELLLLIIWNSSAPFYAHTVIVDPLRPSLNYDACYYNSISAGFLYASIAYKVVILCIGCVLVWWCRNLPDAYNETPYLAATIYQVLFTSAILIPLVDTDSLTRDTRFVVRSFGIIGSTVAAAATLTLPKLFTIITNPDTSYASNSHTVAKATTTAGHKHSHLETRLSGLSAGPRHRGGSSVGLMQAGPYIHQKKSSISLTTPLGSPNAGGDERAPATGAIAHGHGHQAHPVSGAGSSTSTVMVTCASADVASTCAYRDMVDRAFHMMRKDQLIHTMDDIQHMKHHIQTHIETLERAHGKHEQHPMDANVDVEIVTSTPVSAPISTPVNMTDIQVHGHVNRDREELDVGHPTRV